MNGWGLKRPPATPRADWYARVSKADLYDAAVYLAAAMSEGGCDDLPAGVARLADELRTLAAQGIIPARVERAVPGLR